jgi:hypothetical protein
MATPRIVQKITQKTRRKKNFISVISFTGKAVKQDQYTLRYGTFAE